MTNEHTSLEKYTSHTLFERVTKGLCVRGELETETDCNILTPSSSDYSSTSFLILLGCSTGGPGGPSPLLGAGSHCLELQLELQLTDSNYGTGLYNCLTSTCFLWASHLHRIQPVHMSRWYLGPDAPVSRLTAGSKVNMLQNQRGIQITDLSVMISRCSLDSHHKGSSSIMRMLAVLI